MDMYQEWLRLQEIRKQIREIEKQEKDIKDGLMSGFGRKSKIKMPNGKYLCRKKIKVEEHVVPTYVYQKIVEAAK